MRMNRMRAMFATLAALLVLGLVVLAAAGLLVACGGGDETTSTAAAQPATTVAQPATTSAPPTTVAERTELILASTTSTQDSGLFEALIPAFEAAYPYTVKVIAVGSGEAIAMGESGDADVLLVHSPAAEKTFMEDGFGIERKAVMYNDFVIVGPAADPAKIKGGIAADVAFKAIAGAEALFFSRGDDSGTHNKEKAIWKTAGMEPAGDWYQTTGQGMGETLTIADQQGGYTLSDRATYLTKSESLALEILVEGDKALFNQYHVITVKDAVNAQGAIDFMDWITSDTVQQDLIATFGAEKFGQALFVPNAGLVE
jgi:tungstate transport system substrate-binding protein